MLVEGVSGESRKGSRRLVRLFGARRAIKNFSSLSGVEIGRLVLMQLTDGVLCGQSCDGEVTGGDTWEGDIWEGDIWEDDGDLKVFGTC